MAPRAGYTLPVFACAAAVAALRWLYDRPTQLNTHSNPQPQTNSNFTVPLNLIHPAETVTIPIEQVSGLQANTRPNTQANPQPHTALAITRSDPGDNLDLTRNTPIWALVELNPSGQAQRIVLEGGEGIGRLQAPEVPHRTQAAIYGYAQELFQANLSQWLRPQDKIRVTIVLPQGRALAQRTSNAAFGVVDGLSLLGTSGIAQPLSSPDQLALFRSQLQTKVQQFGDLVFCIGENGLDLATQLGINPDRLFKTANWLGPLLVEAGCLGVRSILLFGYHGKLIKLAGGIFHTHHHVADARLEILTAHCAIHAATLGIPTPILQQVFACGTVEEALSLLREQDLTEQVSPHPISPGWVAQVYGGLAATIDRRTTAYIHKHSEASVQVGCVLFDRRRQIIVKSTMGSTLLTGLLRN